MYIDPNSGGMLFQVLAIMFGTISAIILFFSSQIKMMWARLRRKNRERDEAGEDDTAESAEDSGQDS
jgi:hypothetical protein